MGNDKSTEKNRKAWDSIAVSASKWFQPVSADEISRARGGEWAISVTATKHVPREWLGVVRDRDVMCLAGGGGHQGPILAAAGARVTVVDFSSNQLAIDRTIAKQFDLTIATLVADMRSLAGIADNSFDVVVNPCSLNFCPDVNSVWQEVARVLRPNGILITGFLNPVNYLFDAAAVVRGKFVVANKIPCTVEYGEADDQLPVEFAHELDDLVGGQMRAGLALTNMYEDRWGGHDPLSDRIAVFMATRSVKRSSD